jgi:hypothetical protein
MVNSFMISSKQGILSSFVLKPSILTWTHQYNWKFSKHFSDRPYPHWHNRPVHAAWSTRSCVFIVWGLNTGQGSMLSHLLPFGSMHDHLSIENLCICWCSGSLWNTSCTRILNYSGRWYWHAGNSLCGMSHVTGTCNIFYFCYFSSGNVCEGNTCTGAINMSVWFEVC